MPPTSSTGTLDTWQLWVEDLAPSTKAGDIVFTLAGDTNGPPARDIVYAAAMAVDLDVGSSEVDEDGSHGLILTFTPFVALPTPLTIAYDVGGGTATEGIDFTGLPSATGVRSITIPANASTTPSTVFPTRDSEIEYDETVVLTLLSGAGYGLGTRTAATDTTDAASKFLFLPFLRLYTRLDEVT